jgi:hypothetical protein
MQNMSHVFAAALFTLTLVLVSGAVAAPGPADIAQVEDNPDLPRVLLIGDSISIGYTEAVRELLAGEANVHRIPVNGGPTIRGLEHLDEWLQDGGWDVIHFNWGLHDLKRVKDGKPDKSAAPQVPPEEYGKNLDTLVSRMKETGAKLIWASTTVVPEGAAMRKPEDVITYNAVAAEVMKQHGVPTNDLHAVSRDKCAGLHTAPNNVHYTDEGSRVLAKAVAAALREALAPPEARGESGASPRHKATIP